MILSARRLRPAPQSQPHRPVARGFTLIELLIAVAIVGILARIALPAYLDSVKRGKLTEAFNTLSTYSLALGQYYQDNRTYVGACATSGTTMAQQPAATTNFTFSCGTPATTATTITVTATGNAGTPMAGFAFTIDQNGTRNTTSVPSGWPSPPANTSCWIASKSGNCFQ